MSEGQGEPTLELELDLNLLDPKDPVREFAELQAKIRQEGRNLQRLIRESAGIIKEAQALLWYVSNKP